MSNHTGVSMTSFRITKKMKKQAGDGSYHLTEEERKKIKEHNKLIKEYKKQKKLERQAQSNK